jgi:hypothetical protein
MECKDCGNYKNGNCKRQCMDIPDGLYCADCVHVDRCVLMFGATPDSRKCVFEPIRFAQEWGTK